MAITAEIEAEIVRLYARYTDALHQRDPHAWGQTWCKDARWQVPFGEGGAPVVIEGRKAIVATWLAAIEGFPVVQHLPTLPLIEEQNGQVVARWTVREQLKVKADGSGQEILGIYDDLHRVEDGQLRYAERRFHLLGRRPITPDFEVFEHPGPVSF